MKDRLYHILVNRVPGIRDRFLKKRQEFGETKRFFALIYLFWLNIRYYLFFSKHLSHAERFPFYEERLLHSAGSESSLSYLETPESFAQKLMPYDVISFDVFDTLILRPFSCPTDVFYLVGLSLDYPDFRRIRIEAEVQARKRKKKIAQTAEVSLHEIWDTAEKLTGIPKEKGLQTEWKFEKKCCYANPYFLRVVKELQRHGKKIIAISDMYLAKPYMETLLKSCGYDAFSDCFVSCDYGTSKGEGSLYETVKEKFGKNLSYAHVGDNEHSDYRQAAHHHIKPFLYPNVNVAGLSYRPEDMSVITGSVYRGIVNAHIHSGLSIYSREYEYGFIYGGLFVCGYCRFIHHYVSEHEIEKILFFSRDGSVLMKAYSQMYPQEIHKIEYVYWSRLAALKITAQYYKNDYFRRFLYHKVNQNYTIQRVLKEMELSSMLPSLCQTIRISPETKLTHKNVKAVKKYLIGSWEKVLSHYKEQVIAGKLYYSRVLEKIQKAAAIDIGWAGSGAVMLDYAVNQIWNISCNITGIIAGTNSCFGPESDATEPFLLTGKLVSYLYSQQQNRDLWKFHDPAKRHNLYWELLLGAPEGSLKGFYLDKNGNCECHFQAPPEDTGRISEIHRGILAFVTIFLEAEQRIGYSLPVSGRDAYAPMISIGSKKNKKFMESLEELTDDIHIG